MTGSQSSRISSVLYACYYITSVGVFTVDSRPENGFRVANSFVPIYQSAKSTRAKMYKKKKKKKKTYRTIIDEGKNVRKLFFFFHFYYFDVRYWCQIYHLILVGFKTSTKLFESKYFWTTFFVSLLYRIGMFMWVCVCVRIFHKNNLFFFINRLANTRLKSIFFIRRPRN